MKFTISLRPEDPEEKRGWVGIPWVISHAPITVDLTDAQVDLLRRKLCVVEGPDSPLPLPQEQGAPFDEPLHPALPRRKYTKKDKEA